MAGRINRDEKRYLDIVRGKVRRQLRQYLHKGMIHGKIKGNVVKIPLPRIDLPKIIHGQGGSGVGQGEGDEGDVIQRRSEEGDPTKAGDQPGEHIYEEFTLEEVADIMSQELELPNIKPKGKNNVYSLSDKLKTVSKVGSPARLHKKRSFKKALKRSMIMGTFEPGQGIVIAKPDKVFRSYKEERVPEMNALIFYMMDISGSMGPEQKDLVSRMCFLIDIWIMHQYEGVETRYIVHDTEAKEVTRDDFYHLSAGGGTYISSAFELADKILNDEYNPPDWNVYLFYFSDGDNFSKEDSQKVFDILDKNLVNLNLFGYTQVKSPYGSGVFMDHLTEHYGSKVSAGRDSNLVVTLLEDEEGIFQAIKDLLGKGK